MQEMILTLFFSTWIFIWAVLYVVLSFFAIKKSSSTLQRILENTSPIFALWIAIIQNTFLFFYMISLQVSPWTLWKFLGMMFSVKILPLIFVSQYSYNITSSILCFLALFLVYYIYLYFQNETLVSIYRDGVDIFIRENENERK
jgi:hypothetical protein